MFIDLIKIVNFIRSSFSFIGKIVSKDEREKAILEILKTYFLLLDVVHDGETLLNKAGGDPAKLIESLPPDVALSLAENWDNILRKQGVRLYSVQNYILDQSWLFVASPETVEKIKQVIGYKMDRLVTLHAIGATLFFRNMFRKEETEKDKAQLVALVLSKQEDGSFDKDKIQTEINAVKLALDKYRLSLQKVVTDDEIVSLSDKARKLTIL